MLLFTVMNYFNATPCLRLYDDTIWIWKLPRAWLARCPLKDLFLFSSLVALMISGLVLDLRCCILLYQSVILRSSRPFYFSVRFSVGIEILNLNRLNGKSRLRLRQNDIA